MSEMIEQVALRIITEIRNSPFFTIKANGPAGELAEKMFTEHLARAAIEEMRVPTDAMKNCHEEVHWGYSCPMCGGLTKGWRAMIDAALKE
jgi:hypothetical protein